jgi:hypothetical protein
MFRLSDMKSPCHEHGRMGREGEKEKKKKERKKKKPLPEIEPWSPT